MGLYLVVNVQFHFTIYHEIFDDELYEATLEILNQEITEDGIARTIEKKSVENGAVVLKESIVNYYVLDEVMPYGDF